MQTAHTGQPPAPAGIPPYTRARTPRQLDAATIRRVHAVTAAATTAGPLTPDSQAAAVLRMLAPGGHVRP